MFLGVKHCTPVIYVFTDAAVTDRCMHTDPGVKMIMTILSTAVVR